MGIHRRAEPGQDGRALRENRVSEGRGLPHPSLAFLLPVPGRRLAGQHVNADLPTPNKTRCRIRHLRDPAKLARALLTIADQNQPPLRFVAGADADAIEGVKAKANELLAQVEASRELGGDPAHGEDSTTWKNVGRGGYTRPKQQLTEAKAVCRRCPVMESCRMWALAHPRMAHYGVWGAMPEEERRTARRRGDRPGSRS